MSAPRVTVVTIFLDAERFLGEAVESVLAQTLGDWELVLVDDDSTDRSPDVARSYAGADRRVRYVRHPGGGNRGMSASRNLGVSEARGRYVAFLDADDVYRPGKLARQAALLDQHPEADMVYGATEHWYSWTGRAGDATRDVRRRLGVEPETLVRPPLLARLYLSGAAQTPGTCGVLIRREAIEAVGGFEEAFPGLYEDQAFFYKMALRAPVFVEAGSWDRYRQHPGSTVRRLIAQGDYSDVRPTERRHAFLRWLGAYAEREGVRDEAFWALLDRELWPYRHPGLHALLAPVRGLRSVRRRAGRLADRVRRLTPSGS